MTNSAADVPEELLLGQFIPLHYHFNMLRDQTRMVPFREAIRKTVPVGGNVLELGGGTGVLSWFAAQTAGQVWCVERNPALVRASRSFLAENPNGERVTVVHADAMSYLPPEPVDVVICEMLHVGLIREKQLQVIQSFKDRYRARFGPKLPRFIPDTSMLAVQPLQQNFTFHGYTAKVPVFEPCGPHMQDSWLADPHFYSTVDYGDDFAQEFAVNASVTLQTGGHWNAISLLTNNFLAFDLRVGTADQWLMNQLILPLPEPLDVARGDTVSIEMQYTAGCSIETLTSSLRTSLVSRAIAATEALPLRRSA